MPILGGQIFVEVTANTLPAQASLGAMNERVAASRGAFAGMLSQIGSFVAGQVIFALMARAMMEIEKQIKDTATQTAAWDDQLKDLNTVLLSTKNVAGWTADNAIKLADSLSSVTRFSNTSVLAAENLLLTFTAIGKDIMPQATEAVLDMTAKMGGDVQSRVIQLGKALQDPILGMTALRRVGVNFSHEQQVMVKGWVEHGQKARAQKFILAELQTEFGGMARAMGETLPGKLAILNNQFDIIKQTIGNAMLPVITNMVTALVPFITAMASGLPNAIKVSGDAIGGFFGGVSKLVDQSKGETVPAFQQMAKEASTTLGPAITQLGDWIMKVLIPAVVQMQTWFAVHVMPIIVQLGGIIATQFLPVWEKLATQLLTKLIPPLQRIVGDLLPVLIPLAQAVGWVFQNVVGPALGFVIDRLGAVLNFIADLIDMISALVHGDFNKIGGMLKRVAHDAIQAMIPIPGVTLPGMAEGGVSPGGLTIVGERGPEIVSLPTGSRVYPSGSGPAMAGGGSQTVVLQIDGRTMARLLLPSMVDVIRTDAAIRNK